MKSLNKVQLIGHVGNKPEVKNPDSIKVARFSLAIHESYRDKNGVKVENTDWLNIVAWHGLADIAEKYIKNGSKIYIEGKLKSRSWDNEKNQKRYTTEIIAENFILLNKKENEE